MEVNLDFNGKFICGGDLIDRGHETDSCLCLMYHLLKQNGAENKIEYMVGNHEYMVIQNSCDYYKQVSNNSDLARNMLVKLVTDSKMKFASCSNTTIFSHTVLEKDCIMSVLDLILYDTDKQLYCAKKYNIIFNEVLNIQKIENLKNNIYYDFEELNKENIELLTRLLNVIFIEKVASIENGTDLEKQDNIFAVNTGSDINNHKGLLWTREMDNSKQIKGLYQVVGHMPQEELKPVLENGIIKADTYQSNGYNIEFSNATLLNFRYGQCQVKMKKINKDLINEKSIQEYQKPNSTLNIDNKSPIGESLIYLFDSGLIKDADVVELYENIVINKDKILNDNETIYDVLIDYSINLLTRQSENNIDTKELFNNLAVIYDIDEKNKEKYFKIFNTIIDYHKMQKANEDLFFERNINEFQICDLS